MSRKSDFQKMQEEARCIIGKHDFSAFKSEGSLAKKVCKDSIQLGAAKVEI